MRLTDLLIIIATLLSPLIAVQVTRWLDNENEKRDRKLQIYKTLMETRAYSLTLKHVEALNRIDLEFSSKNPLEKEVLNIWQQYLDHLGIKDLPIEIWGSRKVDLLVELLYSMGKVFGYDFNKTQLKNGTYAPIAHGRIEEDQEKIRQYLIEMFESKRNLPLHTSNFPENN